MRCPNCMTENAATRRFCARCGAALPVPCPACGFENETAAKFCGGCGRPIGATGAPEPATVPPSPRADSAERRQLTVMFCDLVGSTPLSARLDPEDLRRIIGAYHRCVAEIVEGFGGFVARYMGDGVLVYFGYPRAHEDGAERATRCGLALVERVAQLGQGEELQARVGIATGLVVVGGEVVEHDVAGETPNLAARLQALAQPGQIVLAGATRRLIGDLFRLRDLGRQALKGFAEPVEAFVVEGVAAAESRFEAARRGLTDLVGRAVESALLRDRLREAWAGCRPDRLALGRGRHRQVTARRS